tara:strand:+ start:1645 stop:1899 length:255 start_codon:yes stop_codon:yes gene_type:complete
MINKDILKKQIIYRSTHRGSKEMDIILGNFVKNYIDTFTDNELRDVEQLLCIEDEILHRWYFDKVDNKIIPNNKISILLKKFKL